MWCEKELKQLKNATMRSSFLWFGPNQVNQRCERCGLFYSQQQDVLWHLEKDLLR